MKQCSSPPKFHAPNSSYQQLPKTSRGEYKEDHQDQQLGGESKQDQQQQQLGGEHKQDQLDQQLGGEHKQEQQEEKEGEHDQNSKDNLDNQV